MPALTRRRDPAAHDETWLIHYDDVHVGTIRMRTGVPTNVDQWGWAIGSYPTSHRGLRASGTAKSFDMARGAFETAWRWLLPQTTPADFIEHRQHRAHEAWKRAMREAGCKLPTQMPDGRSRCFCGAERYCWDRATWLHGAHGGARKRMKFLEPRPQSAERERLNVLLACHRDVAAQRCAR
jgi:hypothetical protein